MRLPLAWFASLVSLTLAVPSAFAQKPIKEPAVFPPQQFAAGEVCPFPVRLETVSGNESLLTSRVAASRSPDPDQRELRTLTPAIR